MYAENSGHSSLLGQNKEIHLELAKQKKKLDRLRKKVTASHWFCKIQSSILKKILFSLAFLVCNIARGRKMSSAI